MTLDDLFRALSMLAQSTDQDVRIELKGRQEAVVAHGYGAPFKFDWTIADERERVVADVLGSLDDGSELQGRFEFLPSNVWLTSGVDGVKYWTEKPRHVWLVRDFVATGAFAGAWKGVCFDLHKDFVAQLPTAWRELSWWKSLVFVPNKKD